MDGAKIFDMQTRRYYSSRDLAVEIRVMRRACRAPGGFLKCVVDHARVNRICREFARATKIETLADPDHFYDEYCKSHALDFADSESEEDET